MNVDAILQRVRAEFDEMPGMRLTVRQASRLFGLEHETCRAVIDRLVGAAYLSCTPAGLITRGDR
jgi:hypothetical protein